MTCDGHQLSSSFSQLSRESVGMGYDTCTIKDYPEQEARLEIGPADKFGVLRCDGPGDNDNDNVEQLFKLLGTPNRFRALEVSDPTRIRPRKMVSAARDPKVSLQIQAMTLV